MRTRPASQAKAGYVLPLVLTVVTALALVVATAMHGVVKLRQERVAVQQDVAFAAKAMTAEAQTAFLLASEPLGVNGLRVGGARLTPIGGGGRGGGRGGRGPQAAATAAALLFNDYQSLVALDDTTYRWVESEEEPARYLISIQDEAGLVNVYQADLDALMRLFEIAGLSSENAEAMAAELFEYNGRPAPAEPIRRLAELYAVPGARELVTDRQFRVLSSLGAVHRDNAARNINTAPSEVLKAWFDLTDDQAARIVEDRRGGPLLGPGEVGITVADEGAAYAFPNGRVRVTFIDSRTGHAYRSTLVLTPRNQERPLWVENARHYRQPPHRPATAQPQDTPTEELDAFPQVTPAAD